MKKVLTVVVIFMFFIIFINNLVSGEPIGVYDIPNSVSLGQQFKIQYINSCKGKNVIVEFYPILSQLFPYQYSADEYHGKKYGNISRLIAISLSLSSSWSVKPQRMNLQTADDRFNITVSLNYVGYWDMFIIYIFPNGTENYMIHSLPQVVNNIDLNNLTLWITLYFGIVFFIIFIMVPLLKRRAIKALTENEMR